MWTNLTFSAQICPKMNFWGRNSKNLSPDMKSAPPRYRVCQFSVTFFPKFMKITQLLAIFWF